MFNVDMDPTEYLYCVCIWVNDNKDIYAFLAKNGIEPWVGAGVTKTNTLKICVENGARLITTNNPNNVIEKLKGIGQKWI